MSHSDDTSFPAKPVPELGGLDPQQLLQIGLETIMTPAGLGPDLDATVRIAAPQASSPSHSQPELPLPEELTNLLPHGNYHVESFLGQGGMGAVYKGMQVRLKRPVAIKIMRRDMGKDYDFEARFEREAQAMAKLNHPNIVSVIDFGEAGADYLYIVMELIDGADLMDVIRGGQMTQEMALALLPQVCDALQFAHDHGIVHRDIKPSNIMLTRDGRVKMCDFGLAKRYDVESSFRTQTGTGMGTPDYAAPEQFDPKANIDHRADIYALGVMIYQMITGQLPRGVWKPPSQRAAIAPQWDDIVSRAMQSDPSDRYQHASEVKTDVSSIPLEAKSAAGTPTRKESDAAGRSARSTSDSPPEARALASTPTKSRTPLLFGLITGAVAIAAGAFFALKKPAQSGPLSPMSGTSGANAPEPAQGTVRTTFVSIPGLPDLPPLTVPPGEPGMVKDFALSGNTVRGLHLLPDSRRLLIVQDEMITLYDLETEKKVWFVMGGKGSVSSDINADGSRFVDCCPFDTAGKSLVAPGPDGGYFEVKLYETATGKVLQNWKVPYVRMSGAYDQVDLSPSGKTIIVRTSGYGTEGATFVALEFGKEASIAKWTAAGPKRDVTHSLSETLFIATGGEVPFQMNTADLTAKLDGPKWFAEMKYFSVLSPDKRWMVASNGSSCSVWDMKTGKSHLLESSEMTLTFGVFAGNDLVIRKQANPATPDNRNIQVWDRATGLLLADYPPAKPGFYWGTHSAGAPNGQFFVNVVAPLLTAPNKSDRILQIWSLPKPGQVCGLVKTKTSQSAPAAAPAGTDTSSSTLPVSSSPSSATKESPFINSLGMKFVPVPITGGPTDKQRVLFSVWETRVQDYEVFAKETKLEWKKPDFEQGPSHPAVMLSWKDAYGFCAWLTDRERKAGKIAANERYRLPNDHEWSCAVGIGDSEDPNQKPAEKSQKLSGVYPWGTSWPPPDDLNLSGEEARGHFTHTAQGFLSGHRDAFPTTAPVGSFQPNALGLFDLDGNVSEWCLDSLGIGNDERVVRGGSFFHGLPKDFLSSLRSGGATVWVSSSQNVGFRIVLGLEPTSTAQGSALNSAKTLPPASQASASFSSATKDAPFTNTLGIKLVPVPIGGGPTKGQRVLFSVWETRVQDYEMFVKETKREWKKPEFELTPLHPIMAVTWDDAVEFCSWLTERERKAGTLGSDECYRLPSDHEWSCAVGIGDREDPAATPRVKHLALPDVYPWGSGWPPPPGAGNFAGEELSPAMATGKFFYIKGVLTGYRDVHVATAPVGSFQPNQLGIHDLGGNVWEWCDDLYDAKNGLRMMRGGSWHDYSRENLVLSNRHTKPQTTSTSNIGFRVVLAQQP